jgi:hypothetical protein
VELKKWTPQIGDHVFSVCEFLLSDYERDKKIPGYDQHGYEIVESVVKRPYRWHSAGMGVETVSQKRLLGSNANNCFYWRPKDYGEKVFQTFEEAIPLAETMTRYDETHRSSGKSKPKFRHWKKDEAVNNTASAV